VWGTAAGLMTGVVLFAIGQAFLYPAMLLLALEGTNDSERGSAVGTISSCFDLSQGLGSLVVGAVAALTSYRGTFAAGALCSVLAVFLLWGRVVPRMAARARLANEVM
jgi:MFS family permease